MPLTNTATHYGGVTKTFHWLTALLIITLIPLGIYANGLPYDTSEELARKAWLFSLHKTLGVTVFFVALARIAWALSQPKPALLHPDRKLESLAAETVHWLLYGSLLLVPLSGWIHHAATAGFAPIWWPFGQNLPLVPKSESLAATTAGLHIVFERVLAASILLHAAGALKHHLIDRDSTLRRMLPGRPVVPDVTGAHRVVLPVLAALVIWAGALATGSALSVYDQHGDTVQAAALEDVQSDWAVEDGTLSIVVKQLGSDVTGSFADWTAAISFDETVTEGPAGSVDVTISVGSLTLGSVTSQALGADFFNATAFPTAQFTADILRTDGGYVAEGTLTIKEASAPVTLPFTLDVADGVAVMQGETTLDRRDFAIGDSQKDESSLGFSVGVTVNLTATEG
ncbi:cytochrome b/b6 domain-containing protein [Roseobacter sp. S98]|uniref:cytochrome b/b6 domain-containing protein n=1 Tax=Roseobacter algicola (ex Choi et al. 2025) (nom. illeg.) TaxID=3092138 RepID=UPI0035C66348